MERLTTTEQNNLIECTFCIERSNCYENISCDEIEKAIGRLKEYENTGLTPEQVVEMVRTGRTKKQLLPCNIGDTIYVVPSKVNYDLNILHKYYDNNRVYEQEVSEIRLYSNGYLIVTCDGMCSAVDVFYKKTWFLTKEEAEAKLKEMESK